MLKWSVTIVPFLLMASGASAVADDLCAKVSKTAMTIMEARQNSEPMAALVEAAEMQPEKYRGITRELVISAYDHELRYSQEAKRREINEFGSEAYRTCLNLQE